MHKKLEADLISLAHSILQMKNKEDVFALKEKSQIVYEKLSLLAFVEEYVNTNPNIEETKEELISKMESALESKIVAAPKIKEIEVINNLPDETDAPNLEDQYLHVDNKKLEAELGEDFLEEEIEEEIEEKLEKDIEREIEGIENEYLDTEKVAEIEQPFDELEGMLFSEDATNSKNDVKDVGDRKTPTLEEELEDTIPVDVIADLFESVPSKSLNDKLAGNIQIGLNDRIAFVKNLFDGSQEDFNRVVSQLNSLKTAKEANKFINKMVKPDYNWSDQEELETRFMEIIQRRFV